MRLLVLSDTHIPHRMKSLPAGVYTALEEADAVIHAGDAASTDLLDELALFCPLYAVAGNSDSYDVWRRLPRRLVVSILGCRIGVMHGDGVERHAVPGHALASFGDVDCVIFGHTHRPLKEWHQVGGRRILLFNPGSLGDPRYGYSPSYGWLRIGGFYDGGNAPDNREGLLEAWHVFL